MLNCKKKNYLKSKRAKLNLLEPKLVSSCKLIFFVREDASAKS